MKGGQKCIYLLLFFILLLALITVTGKFVAKIAKQELSSISFPSSSQTSEVTSDGIVNGKVRFRGLADFLAEKKNEMSGLKTLLKSNL